MTESGGAVFGGRPTIIGHRGSGRGDVGEFVENTRDSLLAGARAGLRWVEFDVRRTADDALVVRHFPTWHDGSFIAQLDLAEARAVGAVTLEEILDGLPPEVGLNLDLKTSLEDALRPLERTTAALLAEHLSRSQESRPLLLSSFDPTAVAYWRQRIPSVPCAYLTWVGFPLRKAIPAAKHLGAQVVAPHWTSFGPNAQDKAPVFVSPAEATEVAHRAGLEVMSWCPRPEEARELLTAGVDAVIVDDVPTSLHELRDLAD